VLVFFLFRVLVGQVLVLVLVALILVLVLVLVGAVLVNITVNIIIILWQKLNKSGIITNQTTYIHRIQEKVVYLFFHIFSQFLNKFYGTFSEYPHVKMSTVSVSHFILTE